MKGWSWWALGFVGVGLVLGGLYAARGYFLPAVSHWLDVGEPLHRADWVMVLPGAESTRPFVAAAVVKAGFARRVLVPEVETSAVREQSIIPPTHEIIRRVLVRRGVREADIVLLEGQTDSTLGDIEALGRFLQSSPEARVAIVTDGYHTRRVRWTVARVLGGRARQVSLVSAPTEEFCVDTWWQGDRGFMAIVGEYLKLAYYALRYGSLVYWLAGAAGAVTTVVVLWRVRARRICAELSR